MKTSNKLIAGLLAVILMAIVGSNMILKAEYEKLDLKDKFFGFSKESSKPFSVIKLYGGFASLTQIQPGKNFEVRINERDRDQVKWTINGDTLTLSYPSQTAYNYRVGDAFNHSPAIYIMAPKLQAIYANNASCKLTDWKTDYLLIKSEGDSDLSGILLSNSQIDSISTTTQHKGMLQIGADNQIGKAVVQVRDSSSFIAEKDVFTSLQIQADSLANVKIPGALFRKLIKQ